MRSKPQGRKRCKSQFKQQINSEKEKKNSQKMEKLLIKSHENLIIKNHKIHNNQINCLLKSIVPNLVISYKIKLSLWFHQIIFQHYHHYH